MGRAEARPSEKFCFHRAATSAPAGLIEMLPAPERSTSDFPPPLIFPFIE
jgi:hypothetical protein